MPDEQRVANNSQTYVADADQFQFETLEQKNGQATVIRFRLEDPRYHAGDVLVVLSGSEIYFHGMIGQLADGWAIASDHRGSLLAATVQWFHLTYPDGNETRTPGVDDFTSIRWNPFLKWVERKVSAACF
jgi:hypothetical protein